MVSLVVYNPSTPTTQPPIQPPHAFNSQVLGPGGVEERVSVHKLDPVTYACAYSPRKAGPHAVVVNYGGQSIPKSPFKVMVGPMKQSRIVAFGPGLETGMVGYPACFTVETNGEVGALGEWCGGDSFCFVILLRLIKFSFHFVALN